MTSFARKSCVFTALLSCLCCSPCSHCARQISEDLVYLTADSPDTITQLEQGKVYILGGLVDRNAHKGLCFRKAMVRPTFPLCSQFTATNSLERAHINTLLDTFLPLSSIYLENGCSCRRPVTVFGKTDFDMESHNIALAHSSYENGTYSSTKV